MQYCNNTGNRNTKNNNAENEYTVYSRYRGTVKPWKTMPIAIAAITRVFQYCKIHVYTCVVHVCVHTRPWTCAARVRARVRTRTCATKSRSAPMPDDSIHNVNVMVQWAHHGLKETARIPRVVGSLLDVPRGLMFTVCVFTIVLRSTSNEWNSARVLGLDQGDWSGKLHFMTVFSQSRKFFGWVFVCCLGPSSFAALPAR